MKEPVHLFRVEVTSRVQEEWQYFADWNKKIHEKSMVLNMHSFGPKKFNQFASDVRDVIVDQILIRKNSNWVKKSDLKFLNNDREI